MGIFAENQRATAEDELTLAVMEETLMELPLIHCPHCQPSDHCKHIYVAAAFLLRTLQGFPSTYSFTSKSVHVL